MSHLQSSHYSTRQLLSVQGGEGGSRFVVELGETIVVMLLAFDVTTAEMAAECLWKHEAFSEP